MDRARKQFEAAGASLTLIGQLTHRHAAHFRRRQGIELPILADNDRASYKAAGAKMGSVGDLLSPKVVAKGALTTFQTGRFQTRTIGHPAQLGGAILITPDGNVAWSQMATDASDNVSADEILAVLAGPAQQHVVT